MARQVSALDRVMGRLFDKPIRSSSGPIQSDRRGRRSGGVGGGRGSSRLHRLSRAAMGRPAAVFKHIRSGNTATRADLKAQMDYVFSKASAVFDQSGRYSNQDTLSNADINRTIRAWEPDWWGRADKGHTQHLLMSYPIGTSVEDVTEITRAVMNEHFNSGDTRYKYVVGVHTDRDHPHAHVIVNRRGSDDKLLRIWKGSEINFQSVRDAMVAHGERRGVYMQSAGRFERGMLDRGPSPREVYAAKEQGREPQNRPRSGPGLEYGLREQRIAEAAYTALAALCDSNGLEQMKAAMLNARQVLREGEHLELASDMEVIEEIQSEAEQLDVVLDEFEDLIEQVERGIRETAPRQKPAAERDYVDLLKQFAPLAPETEFSKLITEPASTETIYNAEFLPKPAFFDRADVRAIVSSRLKDTGIDPIVVIERMKIGADNHYLDREWAHSDLRAHQKSAGHNIRTPEGFEDLKTDLFAIYDGLWEELEATMRRDDLASQQRDEAARHETTTKRDLLAVLGAFQQKNSEYLAELEHKIEQDRQAERDAEIEQAKSAVRPRNRDDGLSR